MPGQKRTRKSLKDEAAVGSEMQVPSHLFSELGCSILSSSFRAEVDA